jgi:hypothetical protein
VAQKSQLQKKNYSEKSTSRIAIMTTYFIYRSAVHLNADQQQQEQAYKASNRRLGMEFAAQEYFFLIRLGHEETICCRAGGAEDFCDGCAGRIVRNESITR